MHILERESLFLYFLKLKRVRPLVSFSVLDEDMCHHPNVTVIEKLFSGEFQDKNVAHQFVDYILSCVYLTGKRRFKVAKIYKSALEVAKFHIC